MDYTAVDGTIMFQSNRPTCTSVTIIDDDVLEDRETFMISLSSSDSDVNTGIDSASITIIDDDGISKLHNKT